MQGCLAAAPLAAGIYCGQPRVWQQAVHLLPCAHASRLPCATWQGTSRRRHWLIAASALGSWGMCLALYAAVGGVLAPEHLGLLAALLWLQGHCPNAAIPGCQQALHVCCASHLPLWSLLYHWVCSPFGQRRLKACVPVQHVPHAVFPMGSWLSFSLCGVPLTGCPAPMMGLVATVLLQLPLFKHVFAWMGCHPAGAAPLPSVDAKVPGC